MRLRVGFQTQDWPVVPWVTYESCCVTRLFHLLFQTSSAASSLGNGYLMSPLLTVWVVQREVMHVRCQNLLLTVRSVRG